MQQQAAARLAGQAPPSLLACAESVCSQAAELEAGRRPAATQFAAAVAQLNSGDLRELRRLLGLLRRAQQAVAREPLPQAVHRVLLESGLLEYLTAAQGAGQEEGSPAAAAAQCEQQVAAPPLPPKLRFVVRQAEQLAAEWWAKQRRTQQQPEQPATAGGSSFAWPSYGDGGAGAAAAGGASFDWPSWTPDSTEDGWGSRDGAAPPPASQDGAALVQELLARLAFESIDDAADGPAPAATQAAGGGGGSGAEQAGDGGEEQQWRSSGAVTVCTVHAAKGLEWSVVLLPFANQGHIPVPYRGPCAASADCAGSSADWREGRLAHLEEERRLFHVAATRARDRLLISYVQPSSSQPGAGGARG